MDPSIRFFFIEPRSRINSKIEKKPIVSSSTYKVYEQTKPNGKDTLKEWRDSITLADSPMMFWNELESENFE